MLAQFNVPESAVIVDYEKLCNQLSESKVSAIDVFYSARDTTMTWAYSAPFRAEPALRANLLLMLFSAAESYYRRVIAETLSLCPIAAEAAAQQQVPLGAIASLGVSNLGLIISDTKGLTSAGEIQSRTRNLLGITIDKNSSLDVAISQFEKICTLRHSIVHSSGELLYNNRRELRVTGVGRLSVHLDDKGVQDVVQIVVNAVRAYNNHLANELIQRWFVNGHLGRGWTSDKLIFLKMMQLFSSRRDALPKESYYRTYIKVKGLMKKKSKGK